MSYPDSIFYLANNPNPVLAIKEGLISNLSISESLTS
jgi:hypothetical protein